MEYLPRHHDARASEWSCGFFPFDNALTAYMTANWLRRAADDRWRRLRTLLRVSDDSCVVANLRLHVSMLEQSQQDMLDAVPGNVAMLDKHGTILAVNTAWRLHADKNGLPDAAHFGIGSNYLNICCHGVADIGARAVAAGIEQVLNGTRATFSTDYPCHDATEHHWFRLTVTPLSAPHPNGAIVMHVDVTATKDVEGALVESECRLRKLLNNIVLICVMVDRDEKITFCNEALTRLMGWQHKEIIGSNWFDVFTSEDALQARQHYATLLANQPEKGRHENQIRIHSGKLRTICWTSSIMHSCKGEVIGVAALGEDITDQKQEAAKLFQLNAKLEKLSIGLIQAQEQERISLARELHDELGQRLALLKFDLFQLRRLLVAPDAIGIWDNLDTTVATLIRQIRVISVSLRPPALDYLGLESALRQLLEHQFTNSATICVFEYVGVPLTLDPAIEIAVYRIVQECITNIVRHAAAERVVVEINGGESGRELELIIRDNGNGFNGMTDTASAAMPLSRSSGLSGMHERVELLGGTFSAETETETETGIGHGTRIMASFNLKPDA